MADILIVDDNDITVQSVKRLLSKEGHNIIAANNGAEAIRLLDRFKFHLVVTDLMMPFVSGMELVKHIHSRFPDTHIIVVSSSIDEKSKRICYELGVDNFFTKPIMPQELVAKMKLLLRS